MIKVSLFQGSEEYGPAAVPLFGAADAYFEKTASATLLPEVSNYIAQLQPRNDSQYVLVNAMGAGEYYGSNINGDRFSEAALVHAPSNWKGVPVFDKVLGAKWAYGFPTFYRAHVFPHHRNKDASRALGIVELAAWNNHMKRVELVTRLDKEPCLKFGGEGIWDKLKSGDFPDVSMGTKVPFDTCSITLDRELYLKAWGTYDPKRHKSPGEAILEFHKALKARNGVGIRGLSITRNDYSNYARTMMNHILPDGRKVWVDNDFPAFFDISFVFIGADKIAKAMLKIAEGGRRVYSIGSAELAEKLSEYSGIWMPESAQEKVAAIATFDDIAMYAPKKDGPGRLLDEDEVRARGRQELERLLKSAGPKEAMTKDVVPNQLAGKAIPLLTDREPDLPDEVQQMLGSSGLDQALATSAGLGMVLRPREFQRVTLISMGKNDLADQLGAMDQVFPKTDEKTEVSMDPSSFSPALAQILAPLMADRSAFGPVIEHRVVIITGSPSRTSKPSTSHSSELLRKIGAAYNGYRETLMQFVPHAQDLIESSMSQKDNALHKLAGISAEQLFTPLSFQYLSGAFLNEVPVGTPRQAVVKISSYQATAGVQRALPLVTTRLGTRHHSS
jgi:hypothetical protein